MYQLYRNIYFGALQSVLCREVISMGPLLGESFNRGSTVLAICNYQ